MTSTSLALVQSIYADWERGEFAQAEWADPDIEFVIADGPGAGSWKGLAAMSEAFRESITPWAGWRVEADEFREIDSGRVLVLQHYAGLGKTSGVDLGEMRSEGANVFEIANGKVMRLVNYFDRDNALADIDAGRFGP